MKLPLDVIKLIEDSMAGMNFGKVLLEVVFHDQKPKFRITKEISVIPGRETSGG